MPSICHLQISLAQLEHLYTDENAIALNHQHKATTINATKKLPL